MKCSPGENSYLVTNPGPLHFPSIESIDNPLVTEFLCSRTPISEGFKFSAPGLRYTFVQEIKKTDTEQMNKP